MNKLTYFLNVDEFVKTFITIPGSPVNSKITTTNDASYLAGIAKLYDPKDPSKEVGRCTASFLCLNTGARKNGKEIIYSDISNYISVNNGFIVSWFTSTTLANLELDSIVHYMVTECIVKASTKIGKNPFYGDQFNLIVSSKKPLEGVHQIWFEFTKV